MSARPSDILRADKLGNVVLPDGSKANAALAHALGYIVLNAADAVAEVEARRARTAPPARQAPAPTAPPQPPQDAAQAHRAAVLALPEAVGRVSSAEYLASTGMSLDRAARFLAGAPLDGAAA